MAMASYLRRMLPPYFKYPVFLLSGFELVFSCLVLAISEAYYKAAAKLLPISYRLFDEAVRKGLPKTYVWNAETRSMLESYQYKMMLLWVISTIAVLFCMLVIIPQFFDFNDAKGNRSHLCLVRRRLAWILFAIQATVAVALGAAIVWAWIGCGEAVTTFHNLFDASGSYMEESIKSELEITLDCTSDDDKEVHAAHAISTMPSIDLPVKVKQCYQNVRMSFIRKWWMDAMLITYFAGHAVVLLLAPLLNKQLIKDDDEDVEKDLLD